MKLQYIIVGLLLISIFLLSGGGTDPDPKYTKSNSLQKQVVYRHYPRYYPGYYPIPTFRRHHRFHRFHHY